MMLIGAMELAIEQARLYEKSCRLADQLKRWQSIFRNDARIYAENPTEDNKLNMDISAKQVEVNKKWADDASAKYNEHIEKYGLIWTALVQ